ncbi:MAG TPA: DUF2911 domain-containing protein [Terriglobales bacterium]|nr:DUF2911 domain-containing protein [Terriglobales bacterium]
MSKVVVPFTAVVLFAVSIWAQDKTKDRVEQIETSTMEPVAAPAAVCSFVDGNQMSVRYQRRPVVHSEELPNGRPWPVRGSLFLFTPVALTVGNFSIPVGAFSLFVIPGHDKWTLIVNKNLIEGATYDETQDLLRIPMNVGELGQPAPELTVSFAHVAPKQCNLRLYYGKTGSWAEFREP